LIKKSKIRLDQLLVNRKLINSKSKAQSMIMAGQVIVNDIIVRSDERNQNAVLVQLEYTIQTDKESLQTITFNFGQFASEEFTQEQPINKGS